MSENAEGFRVKNQPGSCDAEAQKTPVRHANVFRCYFFAEVLEL